MSQKCLTKYVMRICMALLVVTVSLALPHPLVIRAQDSEVVQNESEQSPEQIVFDIRQGLRGPLYAGYYRTWQDIKATKSKEAAEADERPETENEHLGGVNDMSKVPSAVDILFVFDSYVHENSPFWEALRNQYVPTLHQNGTAVVQTLGVNFLNGKAGISKNQEAYPNTVDGNRQLAKDIVETYVTKRGLDGLDIDVEADDYNLEANKADADRALDVFLEIAKLIGKAGDDSSKLLMIDTTLSPDKNPFFTHSADKIDLLLRQYYGYQRGKDGFETIEKEWLQFKKYIKPEQFMIGFSFFEENTPIEKLWFDVAQEDPNNPNKGKEIEGTRAKSYAQWQPQIGGIKGGIFAYAIERDGVAHPRKQAYHPGHPSNKKVPTDYTVSKALKEVMLQDSRNQCITDQDIPDAALRAEILKQVGGAQGNFESFDGELLLENPDIQSLKGLEKFKQLKKLVISGLPSITEISVDNLPANLIRQKGEEDITFEVRNMERLETINLSGLNRQKLDGLDFNSLPALKTINISNNAFDFSNGSQDYKILKDLLAKHVNVMFENQRPEGHAAKRFGPSRVSWSISTIEQNLIDTFLRGGQTISGRLLLNEHSFNKMKLETIENRTFIDPNYTFAQFKFDYSLYTVEVTNHNQVKSQSKSLVPSENATYHLVFKDPTGQEVQFEDVETGQQTPQVVLTVGRGETVLENLALNATVLHHTSWEPTSPLFDGQYNQGEGYQVHQNNAVIFELKQPGVAKYWNLYRSGYHGSKGRLGDVIQAHLSILNDEKAYYNLLSTPSAALDYLKDEANWRPIANFENSISGDTISLQIDVPETRVFKVYFGQSSDNFGFESAELQIVGQKRDVGQVGASPKSVVTTSVENPKTTVTQSIPKTLPTTSVEKPKSAVTQSKSKSVVPTTITKLKTIVATTTKSNPKSIVTTITKSNTTSKSKITAKPTTVKGTQSQKTVKVSSNSQKTTKQTTMKPVSQSGLKAVYRLYHSGLKVHLYTANVNERKVLSQRGWKYEGVSWKTETAKGNLVYRLYHPGVKYHFYTKDANEYKVLGSRGWKQEGIAYRSHGSVPIYRLYHSGIKKHLYTRDVNERNVLSKRGWKYEGIAWYSQP